MATINTRKRLEEDLSALKNMIYRMGGMAAESVEQAVWALKNSDAELAQKVIDDGDLIDELEEKVDAGCMEFAARYQPLGSRRRSTRAAWSSRRATSRSARTCASSSASCT